MLPTSDTISKGHETWSCSSHPLTIRLRITKASDTEGVESSVTWMTHTKPIWAPLTFLDKKGTDIFIAYPTVATLPMTLSSLLTFSYTPAPSVHSPQQPAPASPCQRTTLRLLEPTVPMSLKSQKSLGVYTNDI